MRRTILGVAAAAWLWAAPASAVTPDDFIVKNAEDVVDLCSTPETDPLYTAAINFCHGYLVGALAYHRALYSKQGHEEIVCFPEPRPQRSHGVSEFVVWAKAHPEYKDENAVEALFKFLVEKWPCPK